MPHKDIVRTKIFFSFLPSSHFYKKYFRIYAMRSPVKCQYNAFKSLWVVFPAACGELETFRRDTPLLAAGQFIVYAFIGRMFWLPESGKHQNSAGRGKAEAKIRLAGQGTLSGAMR
jgi:hypothetical protein